MGSWITKTEDETQDWWYENLKRFGYDKTQAFPKNDERRSRRVKRETAVDGTILYDIFKPLNMIVKTYIDDGLPIISLTRGFKRGVVFGMGVLKMSYILKHGPDEEGPFTTEENITRHGKYKGQNFAEAIQNLLSEVAKETRQTQQGRGSRGINIPSWTKNPKDGSLWPQGFTDYEATNEELAEWIIQNYPDTTQYVEEIMDNQASQDLDEIKMTPEKEEFRKHIEDLERKAFGSNVYEAVSDIDIEEYNDYWYVTLPANAVVISPILKRKGFIELDEAEMIHLSTSTQVPPYIKEILMLMQEGDQPSNNYLIRPPKGIPITKSFDILQTKTSNWQDILKLSPMPLHSDLLRTLKRIQQTHPRVFVSEIDANNINTTVAEFQNNINTFIEHGHGKVLELDKVKALLDNIQTGAERLSDLA